MSVPVPDNLLAFQWVLLKDPWFTAVKKFYLRFPIFGKREGESCVSKVLNEKKSYYPLEVVSIQRPVFGGPRDYPFS